MTRGTRSRELLPYSFQELMDKYEGEYVAIIGKRIIAHGRDGKKVFDKARSANPRSTIFLVQVPTEEATILACGLVYDAHLNGAKNLFETVCDQWLQAWAAGSRPESLHERE